MYKKDNSNTDKYQFKPTQSDFVRETEAQVSQRSTTMAWYFTLDSSPSDYCSIDLSL